MLTITDEATLEDLKRYGTKTENERVLLEALEDADGIRTALVRLFDDYPVQKDLRPDLERIRDTLRTLRDLADKEAEAWFTDTNTPAPLLTATAPAERLAAVCLKLSDLFTDQIMDFDDVEALLIVQDYCEIAEKAGKEI